MITKKIRDIANIKIGHTIRRSNNVYPDLIPAIQANHIIQENFSFLKKINVGNPKDKLLKEGDVLISIKGLPRATVFNLKTKAIATSSVAILRIKTNQILPEFLALWLNSGVGQRKIRELSTGAAIKSILISDIRNIKINIPDLLTQQFVINLNRNITQQKELLKSKNSNLDRLKSQIIDKIIIGE